MRPSIQLIRHSDDETPRGLEIKDTNNIFYSQNWEIKFLDSKKTYISPYFVHPALKIIFKLEINDKNIKYYVAVADYNYYDTLCFYFIFTDPSNPNTNIYTEKKRFSFSYSSFHSGYFIIPIPEKSLGDQLNIYFELHYQMPTEPSAEISNSNKGNVGFIIDNNLCFMHSSLQVFYHIPLFRTILYSFEASKIKDKKVLLNTICLFREMEESCIPCSSLNLCFSIDFFKNSYTEQHDVTEFITRWIDCLTKEMRETQQIAQLNNLFGFTMNSIIKTKKSETNETDDDSENSMSSDGGSSGNAKIDKDSEFSKKGENNSTKTAKIENDSEFSSEQNKSDSLQSTLNNENSSNEKVDDDSEFSIHTNTEFFLSLNVTIGFNSEEEKQQEHNLVDCIKEIEQEEKISGEDEPDKFKRNEFNQLPPILQISLNRSEANLSKKEGYQKLITPVNFPEELDIHSTKYYLYAFIAHSGSNQCGHYISHIRNFPSNQWYLYDESKVVPDNDIKSLLNSIETKRLVYVIFYVRKDQIEKLFEKSQIPQQMDEIVKSLIDDKNAKEKTKESINFNFILEDDESKVGFLNKSIEYSQKNLIVSTKDTRMNLYKKVAELFDKNINEIRLWTTNEYGIDRSLIHKSPFSKIGWISNNGHNYIYVQNKKENECVYPGSDIVDFSKNRIQYAMYFIKFFDLRMEIPYRYMGTIVTNLDGPTETPEISKLLGFPEWTKYHYFVQLDQLAIRKVTNNKSFRGNELSSGSIITVQIDFESTEKESKLSKEELKNYAPFDLSKSTTFKDIKLKSTYPIIEEETSNEVIQNVIVNNNNNNNGLPDYNVPFNKYRADNYIASRYYMKHVTVFDYQEQSKPLFTVHFPITIELEELTNSIKDIKKYSKNCMIMLFTKKVESDCPSDSFISNEIYKTKFNDNRLYFFHWRKKIEMYRKSVCLIEIADDGYNVRYKKFVICITRPTPKELLLTLQDFFKDFPKHILPYGRLNEDIKVGIKNNLIYSAMPRQVDHDKYLQSQQVVVKKKKSKAERTISSSSITYKQPPRCYEVRDFTIFREYTLTDPIDLTYKTIRFAAFISPSVGEIAVKVYHAKINDENLLVCFRDPFFMNVKLNSTLKEFKEKVKKNVVFDDEEQLDNVKIEIWHRQKSSNENDRFRDFYKTAKNSSGNFITKDDDELIGLTEQSIIYIIYD